MYFTGDDEFQNMFVYQPTFNTIKCKNTSTEYVITWKSKRVYNSKLTAINNDFAPNIKYKKKVGLQFNNTPLVIKTKPLLNENVYKNVYIVYDLDNWPKMRSEILH